MTRQAVSYRGDTVPIDLSDTEILLPSRKSGDSQVLAGPEEPWDTITAADEG